MIVGIDLGTTNSLIALWRDGRPELVANALGSVLTPSAVSIDASGDVITGQAARERLLTHPERTVASFKRSMGTDRVFTLAGRRFKPEELSALVLMALRADAERELGQTVTDAIITVPAYFGEAQRQATKTAGRLAGLQVDRLLNEPTAAALAYGLTAPDAHTRTMVLDLGGGTFDVSILEMFDGIMEVRASAGDMFLGGDDFTGLIAGLFTAASDHAATLAALPHHDPVHAAILRAAEVAKRALTETDTHPMQLVLQDAPLHWTVTREALEHAAEPLLRRLRLPIERALYDARLVPEQIDHLLLAGGATRMPVFRRLIARLFQRLPITPINPDEVVALGAAVQAGLTMRDAALADRVMTDVSPFTLGVETANSRNGKLVATGLFTPVIERNTVIPASRSIQLSTLVQDQPEMRVNIYQGEARLVAENARLGTLLVPVPLGPAGSQKIDLRLTCDPSGLLEIDVTILSTGQVLHKLLVERPGSMPPEELASRLQALRALKIHPSDRIENQSVMSRLERLFTERLGDERAQVAQMIDEFRLVLSRQDTHEIEQARTLLLATLARLDHSFFQ